MLIGHGSFDGQTAKFNLPGPDMTAADFNTHDSPSCRARNVVFVNTSSSSGPFVEALSAPGRTIITATRNGAEQFTTLFGGYFVEAFSSEAADADKNGASACSRRSSTRRRKSRAPTSAKGCSRPSTRCSTTTATRTAARRRSPTGADGKLAAALSLGSAADAAPLPDDPKLRALYLERRDLERRVESLRLLKDSMEPAKYTSELERLVTDLALKTREIRRLEGDPKP